MKILRWRDIAEKAPFHAARTVYGRSTPFARHGHDFAEVFWIDAGRGEHWINGSTVPLETGCLIFIRPSDFHGMVAAQGEEMRLTNIAFSRRVMDGLRARYFPRRDWGFGLKSKLPAMRQIEPLQLQRINHWADELAAAPREELHIDRFLLNLLAVLSLAQPHPLPDETPAWLAKACGAIRDRENFPGGVERFLALCGRSREHVARCVRHHLGTTPTDYVNRIRIEHARRQIEMGDREILDIAFDCGINNLSHFYKLFRARTGMTPRTYRLAHRRPL